MIRIAFCGGGTGGHVMPAVALLEEFERRRFPVDPYFLGAGRPGERSALAAVHAQHIDLYGRSRSPLAHLNAAIQARVFLKRLAPDLVVGLGGYASIAGVAAATSLRQRCSLLEQNAVPGRATSLLAKLGPPVLAGLPFRKSYGVAETPTGTPVRRSIAKLASLSPTRAIQSDEILLLGGSQGSRILSNAFVEAVCASPTTFANFRIAHQVAEPDIAAVSTRYQSAGLYAEVRPYFNDVSERLARCPIVVSRAGGTTLAELTCAGVPTILVPHAAALRNHQYENARTAADIDGAILIEETQLGQLINPLAQLATDAFLRVRLAKSLRTLTKPEAAAVIVDQLTNHQTRKAAA